MNYRLTVVLLLILLVLVGGYWIWQDAVPAQLSPTPTSVVISAPTDLLPPLSIVDVDTISISRFSDGFSRTFQRQNEDNWWQTVPTQTAVLTVTIQAYAAGLLRLTSRRTISVEQNGLTIYGLESPAYEIELQTKSAGTFLFWIGNPTPVKDGFYLQRPDDPQIYLVPLTVIQGWIDLLLTMPKPTLSKLDVPVSVYYTISCSFSRGVAQLGRALGLGPRGRRFESGRPDQYGFAGIA